MWRAKPSSTRPPPKILPRRRRERDLFFGARWTGDETVAVYEVAKPSYQPVKPRRVALAPLLASMLDPTLDAGKIAEVDEQLPGSTASPVAGDNRDWFERLFD